MVPVGGKPLDIIIENTLKDMQRIVGGYIEVVRLAEFPDYIMICNEEGKIIPLRPNRPVGQDIIYGTFFIVKDDGGDDFVSLNDADIEKLTAMFSL